MNKVMIKCIDIYRKHRPRLAPRCRYHPTCSAYAKEAYTRKGFFYATFLSVKRILRCNPLFKGGYDPIPEKGDKNPMKDIRLQASDGNAYTLADFKGERIVLFFYPKDNTSGCTIEALAFTAHKNAFAEKGYRIVGVSRDSVDSHCKFIDKHGLGMLLLSDPEQKLHDAFDVMQEKNMYGKKVIGVARSTFVIDENGEVVKAFRNVKAQGHVENVLAEL